jgi:hypothetical protein
MFPGHALRATLSISLVIALEGGAAAGLNVGVVSSALKVRPTDQPATSTSAHLYAAQNEFEAFQIVLSASGSDVTGVSAKLATPLTRADSTSIPASNVVIYAERYYNVGTASNDEGAPGRWPDPLVPAVDVYYHEPRNAFPITIPAGENRVLWVDILVPMSQSPGDYAGSIEIDGSNGSALSTVAISLHVGTFALPSTATLVSNFGMGWSSTAMAHCPGTSFPFCGDEDRTWSIRTLYLQSALEHRFTISDTDFQPPFGGEQTFYEAHVLPLLNGTSAVRLPGAKLTSVRLDGGDSQVAQWIGYAQSKGFFDRLVYYPTDEPGSDMSAWSAFVSHSMALHQANANANILITSSYQDAMAAGALDAIDVFVPVIDQLENRPGSGPYAGSQRPLYDAWLAAMPRRRIWGYQSCDEHGCGACGTPSVGVDYTGWPQRVIDSSAVQDRAFPWLAFNFRLSGELYFETTYQLSTAWNDNGQCAFSGSGDGTVFYPGLPSIVGGTHDIPIESVRMKQIREGMEDYEYLTLVARSKGDAMARSISTGLFPHAYACAQTPQALEAARSALFALLDNPAPAPDAGSTASDASGISSDASQTMGDGASSQDASMAADSGSADAGGGDARSSSSPDAGASAAHSGCGCNTASRGPSADALLLAAFVLISRSARRPRG